MLGGGVSHPSQLTTGLVIKSVTTSPTLAGERMLFILQVSILSEQTRIFTAGEVSFAAAFVVRGLMTVVSSMGTEDRYVNFRRRLHRFSQ